MVTSLEGTKLSPDLTIDGTAKHWPVFKQKLLKNADSQGSAYILEAGQSTKASAQFSRRQAPLLQRARQPEDRLLSRGQERFPSI